MISNLKHLIYAIPRIPVNRFQYFIFKSCQRYRGELHTTSVYGNYKQLYLLHSSDILEGDMVALRLKET